MTLKWQCPFTCIVAGATGCGKSYWVRKFLLNLECMVDSKIEEIIWCYGISQKFHLELQKVLKIPIRFFEGVPDLEEISTLNSGHKIVIIDDLMRQTDGKTVDAFTRGSHHRLLSIINCQQNVFHQGKGQRDISLNTHYMVLFKSPRDKQQISFFARQIEPQNSKFVVEAYFDATAQAHGYIVFDFKQSTPDNMRIRTNIFPEEKNIVYVAKKWGVEV